MSNVNLEELNQIEYLNVANINNRHIPSFPYKDEEGKWVLWIPVGDKLRKIFASPAESDYVAKELDDPKRDVLLFFYNFFVKHTSWQDVYNKIQSIRDDFLNLCTILAKINTYFELKTKYNKRINRFVATDLEYLFVVCRSLFDLLQEIISAIWDKVKFIDNKIEKKNLPKSFRKMILYNNQPLTQEEIEKKFNIPPLLGSFYFRVAPFFILLRSYRDKIIHSDKVSDFVFEFDKGFAVEKTTEPFKSFNVWNEKDIFNENLASLRPVIHYVITKTLQSCDDFVKAIIKCIAFPPSLIPNHNVYTRGFHTEDYIDLIKTIEHQRWWI